MRVLIYLPPPTQVIRKDVNAELGLDSCEAAGKEGLVSWNFQ